ncbi:unnamed protein product, partial [Amoebophrya sp. A25]|eukprot:GSA25T00004499001.1
MVDNYIIYTTSLLVIVAGSFQFRWTVTTYLIPYICNAKFITDSRGMFLVPLRVRSQRPIIFRRATGRIPPRLA